MMRIKSLWLSLWFIYNDRKKSYRIKKSFLIVSRNEKCYHQLLKVFKNVANLKVHLIDKAY
jgi:hypothetical protein